MEKWRENMKERAEELQNLGFSVQPYPKEWQPNGFLVNRKYVVGAINNRWRVKGKNKWYWFRDLAHFKEMISPSVVQNEPIHKTRFINEKGNLICSVCKGEMPEKFSAWIMWNAEGSMFGVVHKGPCLETLARKMGHKHLSFELDWIKWPEKFNTELVFSDVLNSYEAIIALLLRQINIQEVEDLAWALVDNFARKNRRLPIDEGIIYKEEE